MVFMGRVRGNNNVLRRDGDCYGIYHVHGFGRVVIECARDDWSPRGRRVVKCCARICQ